MRAPFFGLLALLCGPAAAAELDIHGFLDGRLGLRTVESRGEDTILSETRLQLERAWYLSAATLQLRGDLLYDASAERHSIDLEAGEGFFDLREANLLFSPTSIVDIKIGRQILTWGTGDLLFINDLFPKDWRSFFIGRDEEYLKAPSDSVFASFFPSFASIDIAYTPRFDPDRYLTGERVLLPESTVITPKPPDQWGGDAEIALRIYRSFGSFEWALYAYDGFFKSPAGQDQTSGQPSFPALRVFGASARGPVGKGIVNAETGIYHSQDDPDGDDPLVANSELRLLAGYQWELVQNLSVQTQYYIEQLLHYDDYERTLPPGAARRDETRQLLSIRLTAQLLAQNLTVSLFGFYSPTDDDSYIRPSIGYKLTDGWLITAGGNIFLAERRTTFFGQIDGNDNAYVGARFSF